MINRSTGRTPFTIVYQHPPRHTLDLVPLPQIPGYSHAAKQMAKSIETIQSSVRTMLESSTKRSRVVWDLYTLLRMEVHKKTSLRLKCIKVKLTAWFLLLV